MKPDKYDLMEINGDNSSCLFTEIKEGIRATWEITGRCNMGCKHCCVDATESIEDCEPDIEAVKDATTQISDLGIRSIYLSGGEPLTWKNVYEFIHDAKSKGMNLISMATNGILVDEKSSLRLSESGVDKVLISFDSHEERIHDEFRGRKGSFRKSANALRRLSKEGIYTRIGTTIWEGNVDSLDEFSRTMYNMGADEISFNWLMKTGRALKNPDIFVPDDRYFGVGAELGDLKSKYDGKLKISYHRFHELNEDSASCKGGSKFLFIDPKGRLSACSWIAKISPDLVTSGNIYDSGIDELVSEGAIQKYSDIVERRDSEYGPGCPAICYINNGTFHSKDPLLGL